MDGFDLRQAQEMLLQRYASYRAQWRSFCQWLSLRMMVLITATAVSLFKLIAGTASDQLRMMQVFSDQQSAHHILNFFA